MNRILAIVALLFALPAAAGEVTYAIIPSADGSVVIFIPPEGVKACKERGGCRILNTKELKAYGARIAAEAKKTCGPSI